MYLAAQFGEFILVEPERDLPVAHRVSGRVGVLPVEELDGKRRLYNTLAGSAPRGEIRLIDDAGHVTMHLRRPDAVLRAIQDLLGT